MTERTTTSLEHPDEIRSTDAKRRDGRPTGDDDSDLKPGIEPDDAPTVAPEEKGGSPSTEHAPGGDL